MQNTTTPGFGRAQLAIVLLLFAFSVMSYFDRTIMAVAGPTIIKEFGISPTQMGWVYSAFICGYFIFMMPGGQVADRLGPRSTLLLMGMVAAVFTAMTPLGARPGLGSVIGVVPALAAIRFLLGVGTAPLYPACARMSASWISELQQGRVQAFVIAGASLGTAIPPLLFSYLMKIVGWRLSFVISGLATAILAMIWLAYAKDRPPASRLAILDDRGPQRTTSWRSLLTDRNLILVTFAYFALGYFEFIFYYWIFYYFGQVRKMSPSQTQNYTTILFLVNMVMMPLGGWVSDRLTRSYGRQIGRRLLPTACMVLSGILLYAGVNTPAEAVMLAVLSLAIGFASWCEGPFWASATEIGGRQVGAATSMLNAGGNVGGFFAPVVTPFIASRAGWSWGLYFGCLVVGGGAICCFFMNPDQKEQLEEMTADVETLPHS